MLAALERILSADPNNLEALVQAAEAAAIGAQAGQARAYADRLKALAPDDPRIPRVEATVLVAAEGAAALGEARRLAAAGQREQALARYRSLFRNDQPPPFLLAEYWLLYSEQSDAAWDEAAAAMQRASDAAPRDLALRLAYGRMLTYREWRRAEGIQVLRQLVSEPAVSAAARAALRDGVLWEGDGPEVIEELRELLRTSPGDQELQAKLRRSEEVVRPLNRTFAWSLIADRNYAEAERRLRALLEEDPRDVWSIMGLALIRGIQGRREEAMRLRAEATGIQPDLEEEFRRVTAFLDDGSQAPRNVRLPGGRGFDARAFVPASTLARRALERGRLDEAERLARRAAGGRGDDAAQGQIVLGQAALRRDDAAGAEARFRAALALRPGDREATQGLYFALQNQDRFAEAEELQRRAGLPEAPGGNVRRAFALRDAATRMAGDGPAIEALQEALGLDPGNVFVRLDLARRLRRAGDAAGARTIEEQMARSGQAEALGMAALLAADEDRFGEAVGHLSRIPDRVRTSDQARLLAQLRAEVQVRQLEGQARLGAPGAREALLALAARPDPAGASGANAARAFGRLNDREGAVAAARAALLANPRLDGNARVEIAAALAEAQATAESTQLLDTAERAGGLSAENRRQATFLREQAAVGRADRRTAQGDVAGAWEELAPHLRGPAASPNVSTALMRTYARARRYAEAKQVAEALLARDPLDADIRASAVDLAVEMEEYGVAEALLAEGRRFDVASPQLLLAESRVARARRNPVRELRALEAATRMRLEQLRVGGEAQQAALAAEYLSPARAGLRPLPDMADPQTAQMLREMARARDEAAAWIQAGVQVNARSGEAGLSRATTLATPVEVSAPVPGLQGRVSLATGSVTMFQGNLGSASASGRQFGTNALANGRPLGAPDRQQAGAPLSVGYTGQWVRADIGTTPLGFRRTNVVGGVEVVVPLHARANLRLLGENRPVTDSLLSYASLRDPLSGQSWGAVTRAGGRGQLEVSLTPRTGLYAGGGAYALGGRGVRDNSMYEVFGGAFHQLWNTPRETLSVGVDLRHSAFDRNLAFFTLGHGGYFSPQRSNAASLQADWRKQLGDWTLRAVGSVGWQWYYSRSAPLFPNDPGLQAQAESLAAADPSVPPASFASQRASGPTGSLFLNAEYALAPQWRVGAAGRFMRVGDYEDVSGMVYLRYRLDPAARDTSPLLRESPRSSPYGSFPFPGAVNQGRPEPVTLPLGGSRPIW
ncbi:cellulose synthase subunit BcsC-related outer membrane protein [Roseococcus sp. DSY-14]|uniref:cellulose synthase subunit BcsC-related outer membrane protein n=1 Tax=Roseococcus sp. DSY-14 TaxID=3369650 RepID=UPI00387ABBA3